MADNKTTITRTISHTLLADWKFNPEYDYIQYYVSTNDKKITLDKVVTSCTNGNPSDLAYSYDVTKEIDGVKNVYNDACIIITSEQVDSNGDNIEYSISVGESYEFADTSEKFKSIEFGTVDFRFLKYSPYEVSYTITEDDNGNQIKTKNVTNPPIELETLFNILTGDTVSTSYSSADNVYTSDIQLLDPTYEGYNADYFKGWTSNFYDDTTNHDSTIYYCDFYGKKVKDIIWPEYTVNWYLPELWPEYQGEWSYYNATSTVYQYTSTNKYLTWASTPSVKGYTFVGWKTTPWENTAHTTTYGSVYSSSTKLIINNNFVTTYGNVNTKTINFYATYGWQSSPVKLYFANATMQHYNSTTNTFIPVTPIVDSDGNNYKLLRGVYIGQTITFKIIPNAGYTLPDLNDTSINYDTTTDPGNLICTIIFDSSTKSTFTFNCTSCNTFTLKYDCADSDVDGSVTFNGINSDVQRTTGNTIWITIQNNTPSASPYKFEYWEDSIDVNEMFFPGNSIQIGQNDTYKTERTLKAIWSRNGTVLNA